MDANLNDYSICFAPDYDYTCLYCGKRGFLSESDKKFYRMGLSVKYLCPECGKPALLLFW